VVSVGVGVRNGVGVDKGVGAGEGLETGVCVSIGDAEGVGAGAQLMQLPSTPRIVAIKIQVVNRKRPLFFTTHSNHGYSSLALPFRYYCLPD
jgi:hypothetical protein